MKIIVNGIDAALFLGCHAIRVNLDGGLEKEEAAKVALDSLRRLADYSKDAGISILVQNHEGFSSNMAGVVKNVDRENCGRLLILEASVSEKIKIVSVLKKTISASD